ncbi:sensor histidine kinase [Vallitalea okinawensis]|uniref:sensor histidine kinase n=1 Tax=Vallitalea okinawensis TaxID=2078660 RepID=UPI000CFC28BB|nr:HAMP domain-containing sensor histidine kinase [Vallitalea okinawensis]
MIQSKSLSIQIWLWFIGAVGIIGIIIACIIYGSLQVYLEEQLYINIEEEQQMLAIKSTALEMGELVQNVELAALTTEAKLSQEIKHIVTTDEAEILQPAELSPAVLNGDNLAIPIRRYEAQNTYAVISEQEIGGQNVYIYSYAIQNMKEKVLSDFWYVFLAIFIVLLLLFIPAHLISKRLIKPLMTLKREMERIAKRQWNNPIIINGSNEFTSLAESCESMRQQLVAYDCKQQNMLQSISHELKTPIMVIRSYIQATRDGFYPKGSLDTTLEAIDQEANRLQKRVLDLIYITNLDYLATHHKDLKKEEVNLKDIILDVYERLHYKRTDIHWDMELEEIIIKGDQEQWKVVFENILQNGLRYSKKHVSILLREEKDTIICKIHNDGPTIDDDKKDSLFKVFEKGNKGESGLGLNIVKRIVDLYNGKVWFENENGGVVFYISIPRTS